LTLVAAAILLILTSLVVAGLTRGIRPEPVGPSMGTLDVRTLSDDEAQRQLSSCLAVDNANPEVAGANWVIRYARMQYQRAEQMGDDRGSVVLVATSSLGVLRCTEDQAWTVTSDEPDLRSNRTAALVIDDAPSPSCPGRFQGDSAPVVLLKTGATVTLARGRLTIDRKPGRWWTAGVQGGFVHLPLVDGSDPTRLARAGQLSYEVQVLDAKGATLPITTPAGPQGGTTTYVHEVASCADRMGHGVRPAGPAAAAEECTRLTSIVVPGLDLTAYRWVPGLDEANRQVWMSLPPDSDGVLCSLYPVRGIRFVSHGTSLEDQKGAVVAKDHLYFSLTDQGGRGIYIWTGGVLDEPVSSISYTFPNGEVAHADVSERSWILSYQTDRPFLDGRPLDRLPPVEVDVVLPSGQTLHYTIPFTSVSACAQDLPERHARDLGEKGVNDLC
jgi:hypothetical protein